MKFEKIQLKTHKDERGKLTAIELKDYVDWPVKRVYYVTDVTLPRGGHAVRGEKKMYACMQGSVLARLHDGRTWHEFEMCGPSDAILMNDTCYREFKNFAPGTVLMAISNMNYTPDAYIYDLDQFIKEAGHSAEGPESAQPKQTKFLRSRSIRRASLCSAPVKKVLITGGAGFIGSNFVHYYVKQYPDDAVIVLDKLTYAGNLDNLSDLSADPEISKRLKFVQGDIADNAFVQAFFEKERPDVVVNFAAETHVDRSITEPSIFVMTNVVGTSNLLEASRFFGVTRYHQISTDEVYGDLGGNSKDFFTEESAIQPNCPYAASKAAADVLVRSYFETYKMPVTISRCSNNYGPYQFPEKLIPYFFRLIAENKPVPVYGDGRNVRDWIYVIDHCRAIDLILGNGRIGAVYNVGGHNERTNLELTKILLKFFGKNEDLIVFVDDRLAHDRRYAIDPSKIERELKWKPTVTFQQGIQKTFEWYESHRDWWQKLIARGEERKHKKISKTPLEASRV